MPDLSQIPAAAVEHSEDWKRRAEESNLRILEIKSRIELQGFELAAEIAHFESDQYYSHFGHQTMRSYLKSLSVDVSRAYRAMKLWRVLNAAGVRSPQELSGISLEAALNTSLGLITAQTVQKFITDGKNLKPDEFVEEWKKSPPPVERPEAPSDKDYTKPASRVPLVDSIVEGALSGPSKRVKEVIEGIAERGGQTGAITPDFIVRTCHRFTETDQVEVVSHLLREHRAQTETFLEALIEQLPDQVRTNLAAYFVVGLSEDGITEVMCEAIAQAKPERVRLSVLKRALGSMARNSTDVFWEEFSSMISEVIRSRPSSNPSE